MSRTAEIKRISGRETHLYTAHIHLRVRQLCRERRQGKKGVIKDDVRFQVFDDERRCLICDLEGQLAYLCIEDLFAQLMQVHLCMGQEGGIVFVTKADRVQLNILNRDEATHRIVRTLLLLSEGIDEELIIPRAIRQTMDIPYYILKVHMRKMYLLMRERHRAEMGIELADIGQGITLLISQIDIAYSQARGETIFYCAYVGIRTQRARQFSGCQLHGSRLHFIA